MKSSIFLNDITVIDHAFISNKGKVIGGSFNASFLVTGEVSKDESVVVDFSTIKKDIKQLIDQHNPTDENGFDHKLWLINGFSNYEIIIQPKHESVIIFTDTLELVMPLDTVKNIYATDYNKYIIANVIADYLVRQLKKSPEYKNIDLNIRCNLNEKSNYNQFQDFALNRRFRYVHGLKSSTSYGCRNISHGHFSFIILNDKHHELINKIYDDINNAIFVFKENITLENQHSIIVEYNTEDGRYFKAVYDKSKNNIIVLDTETTIEYLAKYIKEKYNIICSFAVSEGLSKGAYIEAT
jgi:hypothetical protein